MKPLCFSALALSLTLFAQGGAKAQTAYKIRPILKLGEMAGDVRIPPDLQFNVGTLNDTGQIIFGAGTALSVKPEFLVQYAGDKLTPIVVPGGNAPIGKWPNDVTVNWPLSMNQRGNVVFAVGVYEGIHALGTFVWDYQAQKPTPVALTGMPAVDNLTFAAGGGYTSTINNQDEIALVAEVKNAAGELQQGVFFRGRDGRLLPVALPDQALPGGGKVASAGQTSSNDAGVVGFMVRRDGEGALSGYVWEQGTITPVAVVGTELPDRGKITAVSGIRVNNKNHSVLVATRTGESRGDGLYLFENGKLSPRVVPGKAMPGGGAFKTLQEFFGPPFPLSGTFSISFANETGQHAFLATLEDGSTAAYLMDADGKLSLILKQGGSTDLGRITRIGGRVTETALEGSTGVGLNSKGQVALPVQIDGGTDTIVLLTPVVP